MKIQCGPLAVAVLLLFALPAGAAQQSSNKPSADPLHSWVAAKTPAELKAWVDARLAAEKADIDKLIAVKGPRTVENTLRLFDDAQDELAVAGNNAYLMYSLADTAAMRNEGQAMETTISQAATALSLNREVYDALAAVPPPTNDPATSHYLKHTLLEYRLVGVDKDAATRAKIRSLQDRITKLSLTFGRNIADGTLKVTATRAELDGLPPDFIARHKPDAHGIYTLTTDQPDAIPVLTFAKNAALRRRMFIAYYSRAYPQNGAVLHSLLEVRQELATTLGYARYADMAAADKLIGSAANIQKLLNTVDEASRPAAHREYAELLAFAQKRDPGLKTISLADSRYWMDQYRRAKYGFNAQDMRPYLPYAEVQAGILKTAARFFHLTFKPVKNAVVWNPSVSTFDVYDNAPGDVGRKLGRIYLDMHPRTGKDKWFSSGPVIPGIRGRQLPEAMLICNFPGGVAGDPGLMDYSDVVIFFHEFGHLMHFILGGRREWSAQDSFDVEFDFVEAPSQMLEEVIHDPAILESFARQYKTGAVIPAILIAKMNAASAYGRAHWLQDQVMYSTYSLQLYDRAPASVHFDALWQKDAEHFIPFAPVAGTHFFAAFTHLTGYASNYYTYVLDKEIALDFFAQFNKNNLLNDPTTLRYRREVLQPGASRPATELIKDFLGRQTNMSALKVWMDQEFQKPQAASK